MPPWPNRRRCSTPCTGSMASAAARIRTNYGSRPICRSACTRYARMRSLPNSISTGCRELDEAWATYGEAIVSRPGVLIPDTDEDLNWHAFLGHAFDMQGFRAGEFAGVDQPPKGFIPLRERDIGVEQLAGLWLQSPIRDHLLVASKQAGMPMTATYAVLRSGGAEGTSLA